MIVPSATTLGKSCSLFAMSAYASDTANGTISVNIIPLGRM